MAPHLQVRSQEGSQAAQSMRSSTVAMCLNTSARSADGIESNPAINSALGGQLKPSKPDSAAAASTLFSRPAVATTAKRVRGCWLRLQARSARPCPSWLDGTTSVRRPPAAAASSVCTRSSRRCSAQAAKQKRSKGGRAGGMRAQQWPGHTHTPAPTHKPPTLPCSAACTREPRLCLPVNSQRSVAPPQTAT